MVAYTTRMPAGIEGNTNRQQASTVERQQMHAAQVEVGVRRREAIKMCPADRGKHERIRMLIDLLLQQLHWDHVIFSRKGA